MRVALTKMTQMKQYSRNSNLEIKGIATQLNENVVDEVTRLCEQIATYVVAPDDTVKGVIHGIPVEDTDDIITTSPVHPGDPSIVEAIRIGQSNSVIILFQEQAQLNVVLAVRATPNKATHMCQLVKRVARVTQREQGSARIYFTSPQGKTHRTTRYNKAKSTVPRSSERIARDQDRGADPGHGAELHVEDLSPAGQGQEQRPDTPVSPRTSQPHALLTRLPPISQEGTVARLLLQPAEFERRKKEAERNEAGLTPKRKAVRRNMTPLISTTSGTTTEDEGAAMQQDTTNQDIDTRMDQPECEIRGVKPYFKTILGELPQPNNG
ncbi:hypothetical protein HPB47_021329 [Ixodes persulcatus]|uniref:Uncharacterized protein n=1 Tax=Ixodes persulcatus TaxID=34615 RepID=A0AC60QDQ1_IXOPE|nr:hypothetical protein HPB47_021329 [Ixodes persulcatus]